VCNNLLVTRKYELKSRAERMEATRRRIVEAAIELHRTKGPARTTLTDIARRAGVERHTLYRHFPDERAIGLACSGLHMDRNPPPDADSWAAVSDPGERLRAGLNDLYAWFERNEDMFARVLRDAEFHELTREMFELRSGEAMGAIYRVLGECIPPGTRAAGALALALDFRTWQSLARSGLSREEAVETMVAAVLVQQ
jgi:AcrR family transcriptional regulator